MSAEHIASAAVAGIGAAYAAAQAYGIRDGIITRPLADTMPKCCRASWIDTGDGGAWIHDEGCPTRVAWAQDRSERIFTSTPVEDDDE